MKIMAEKSGTRGRQLRKKVSQCKKPLEGNIPGKAVNTGHLERVEPGTMGLAESVGFCYSKGYKKGKYSLMV